MSRYIYADELGKVKFHPLPYTHIVPNGENVQSYERGWNDAIDAVIENAPTVDAVEVVRCKNCTRQCICYHSADYYCADGERMSE